MSEAIPRSGLARLNLPACTGPEPSDGAPTIGAYGNSPPYAEPPATECGCAEVDEPVCGSNGNSYSSPCAAECADVTVVAPGQCIQGCICPPDPPAGDPGPVCGVDGVTYSSNCLLDCVPRLDIAYLGPCRADCNCTTEEAAVCATDSGNEYTNSCFADCAGVEWREGTCEGSAVSL
jgi:Kazal-type serine protease inhibitor domain